jgi:Opioid growth factor receptor (OGFr) conserved region
MCIRGTFRLTSAYGLQKRKMSLSRIIEFYKGENVHPLKYTIEEIWTWEGRRVETIHNFIQWLFPLDVPSANSFKAPILTTEDIEEFRTNTEIRNRMMKSLRMMLKYYGFAFAEGGGGIAKANDFEARSGWIYPNNHNYLRISRMLKCLMLLDFPKEAHMFFSVLKDLYRTHRRYIGPTTYEYWCKAVEEAG